MKIYFNFVLIAAIFGGIQSANFNLSAQVNALKAKVNKLEQYRASRSTYCSLHASGSCDSCICKDDFNLPEKFYCDCQNLPAKRDCLDFFRSGSRVNGIYKVTMNGLHTIQVFCDQVRGGWTVIQRRMDGSTNFYRNWQQYKVGFGQLHREFWLGNDNIHLLTVQAIYPKGSEARIDFRIFSNSYPNYHITYSHFQVDNEKSNYMLHVSGSRGNLVHSYFTSYNNKQEFSTYDKDNDGSSSYNCARSYNFGGWWYNGNGNTCTSTQAYTNLNGPFDKYVQRSWHQRFNWAVNILEYSEIKVRRLI